MSVAESGHLLQGEESSNFLENKASNTVWAADYLKTQKRKDRASGWSEEGEEGPWRQEKVTRRTPHHSQQLGIALSPDPPVLSLWKSLGTTQFSEHSLKTTCVLSPSPSSMDLPKTFQALAWRGIFKVLWDTKCPHHPFHLSAVLKLVYSEKAGIWALLENCWTMQWNEYVWGGNSRK